MCVKPTRQSIRSFAVKQGLELIGVINVEVVNKSLCCFQNHLVENFLFRLPDIHMVEPVAVVIFAGMKLPMNCVVILSHLYCFERRAVWV